MAGLSQSAGEQPDLAAQPDVAGVLEEITASPEFASPEGQPVQTTVLEWIGEALSALWEWFGELLGGVLGGDPRTIANVVVVVAVVALVVALVRRWARVTGSGAPGDPEGTESPPARSVEDWRALAAARAAAGNYRGAAAALYQAFVLGLDRAGRVAYHPSKTPDEYAVECRDAEPGAGRFLARFQQFSFGAAPATAGGYRELDALMDPASDRGAPGGPGEPLTGANR